MSKINTPATQSLDLRQIPYRIFVHSGPILSLEQAAVERGQRPDQVVRSILFRISEGSFILILVSGPRQVSWPALRKFMGKTRLTMATEEEVRQVTGYTPGTVTPLGLPTPIPIAVDQSVLEQGEISLGSGQRGVAIIMKVRDLLSSIEPYQVGRFTDPS
jgi:Cys-tRNA(Pro) deacylase